jgi:radical SAM protein with 4Fe4S-binding SPASM domain
MEKHDMFPTLAPGVSLKRLEEPCLYHAPRDELYRLSEEAFGFFLRCDGTSPLSTLEAEEDFLEYCLSEGLLVPHPEPHPVPVRVGVNERPSLRYLMVEVTSRCNLACLHCYLGDPPSSDMEPHLFHRLVDEFEEMGGLRFIVTGGEPLQHPRWEELVPALERRDFRSVLVTNGLLLSGLSGDLLPFHEVQVSLDGLEKGHDHLRGEGTFRRALEGLGHALELGKDVSVATVVHSRNLGELEGLGRLLGDMGVMAWTLEYPVPEGRLAENRELLAPLEEALPLLELGWGTGPHEASGEEGCGAHMACVTPMGTLVKCGYFREVVGGDAGEGLRAAWKGLPRTGPPSACLGCPELPSCGGGCLYRGLALGGPGSPDPLACRQRGRTPPLREGE